MEKQKCPQCRYFSAIENFETGLNHYMGPTCTRFPQWVKVKKTHHCGEFLLPYIPAPIVEVEDGE